MYFKSLRFFVKVLERIFHGILGSFLKRVRSFCATFGWRNAWHEEAEMDPVTAIRLQAQVPSVAAPPASDRVTSAPMAQTAPLVTEVERVDAVRQPAISAGIVTARLAERDESEHPAAEARAAADAAREAYIKASIAAGVSPLPLP
jgi:hypothetical protein